MSDTTLGFLGAIVATIGFGSNYVVVKKFPTGDGIYFQWLMCCAIWITGFAVNVVRNFPPFEPFAMLGGFFWCTGNMLTVPIIKTIGLSIGLLIWGMVNLCMGWLSGTFGLFGLKKQKVNKPALNYIGFALAIVSTVIYVFVKPNLENVDDDNAVLINEVTQKPPPSVFDNLSSGKKKALGALLSIAAGLCYGVNFDPVQYLIDNHPDKSQEMIDYVWSHFTGLYMTSTFYFIVYSILKGNKPRVYSDTTFPSFVCGLIWAVADVGFFIANSELSMVIAFPIVATGPGIVGALWGIFAFREIRGTSNILVLLLAFVVTIVAVTLISLSQT
eukprot:TRINITY_DN7578_c0_g2_i1.p1 TRINITY_DN7578_c0_g2~~TRINITY_DN7578_c0_g2_i1.p1  ORF type:complete len:343 (-),score=59.58 TRINITY_DN7578_c0_g2_i1:807-1796(-)